MEPDKFWRFQSQTSTGAATGAYRTQSGRNAAAQHQAPAFASAVMSAIVETRMEFIAREPRVVKAGSSLGSVECDNKEKYMRSDMNLEQKNGVTAATQDVLTHHLDCFGKGDLASTMTDYTDESRFFTPDGMLRGSEAIRLFFARLFEEFAKPGMSFEMVRQEVCGDTAYIVWKAETADNHFEVGTDTFIVQNGKIVTQTFAGKISPKQ
jgi:hypothetical protein